MVLPAALVGFGKAALGSIAGASGDILSGALNTMITGHHMFRQYQYQSKLQKQAAKLNYDYGMKQLLNQPATARKGMEQAGYNPLLALDSTMNSGFTSPGSVGLGSSNIGNIGDDIVNGYRAFKLEREMNEKQQQGIDSNIELNDANATLARQQATTEEKRRELWQSQMDLNFIDHALKSKELNWYDRKMLTELQATTMNAISNRIGVNAAMSQAGTAHDIFMLNDALNAGNKKKAQLEAKILSTGVGDYGFKYDWVRSHYPNPGNAMKFMFGAGAAAYGAKNLKFGGLPSNYDYKFHASPHYTGK